jgi:plastocyanin
MRSAIAAVIACCAVMLVAGCGSSGSSSSGSTAGTESTASSGTTSTTAAATTKTSSSSSPSASLKATTTPRYATPSSSSPVQSGVVPIAYRDITIAPDTVRVKVGSTLKWTNYDSVQHNVTSEGGPQQFASKAFGEGKSFEVKVTKPGVIHYECTIHPATMNGTIEVVK